jgi:excisionase family DNA binding protein
VRNTKAPLQIGFGLDEQRAVLSAIGSKLFLTVPEVSDFTRVDQRTLRRAIEDNQIPAVRIGNTVRIPTAAFLRLAAINPEDETAPVGETGAVALLKTSDASSNGQSHDNHPLAG